AVTLVPTWEDGPDWLGRFGPVHRAADDQRGVVVIPEDAGAHVLSLSWFRGGWVESFLSGMIPRIRAWKRDLRRGLMRCASFRRSSASVLHGRKALAASRREPRTSRMPGASPTDCRRR